MVFKKGESGNPKGRPHGSRNKTTLATIALLEEEGDKLTRKAIELALNGDVTALRLCLERIVPPSKEKPLESFELPEITSQRSVLNGLEVVAQKLSNGEILPAEATAICRVLEQYRKHYETTELTERLDMLEQTLKGRNA